MVNICDLIKQLKDLYDSKEKITFKLPAYEVFHERLTTFIYENHFEKTKEWEIISGNLLYKSSQYMIRSEADNILLNLELLKRKVLANENEDFWSYIHSMIAQVSRGKYSAGYYADAVESAFKEINIRIKKLYIKYRNEERDGKDLMLKTFSPNDPLLTFEELRAVSGKNVQEGYMYIFAGAIQGIRNPKAHDNMNIAREDAIKRLVFASLLMDKVDEALLFSKLTE